MTLLLSAWLATYLLFDFCKGFDCDAQEINWLHLARKKKKKKKESEMSNLGVFVLVLFCLKSANTLITGDLEAPSVNTCIILFLHLPQETEGGLALTPFSLSGDS